jgi:hypothetical protein
LDRGSLGSAGRSVGRVGRTFPLRRRLSTQYEKNGLGGWTALTGDDEFEDVIPARSSHNDREGSG